jgi:hypothetical protein
MQESPLFSRTYDMLLWLIPQANRFPRAHRFGLGERVVRLGLSFQETIIAAALHHGRDQQGLFKRADVHLAQLRQVLRLCKDLELLSVGQYEHIAARVVEVGKLLGGWMKT